MSAQLQLDASPAVGQALTLSVLDNQGRPLPGISVRVRTRPGLHGETESSIGITDSLGKVRWTPDVGGTVALSAGDASQILMVEGVSLGLDLLVVLLIWGGVVGGALVSTLPGFLRWLRR